MKTQGMIRAAVLTFSLLLLASCGRGESAVPTTSSSPIASTPTRVATAPTATLPVPITPAITGMQWDPNQRIVSIRIDHWPATWSPWTMYVDGEQVSTGEAAGGIIVRPNAEVTQNPSGLIVGTLPWVSGLEKTDFPCCGSMQFSVPELGMTNSFEYNFRDQGCTTASARVCRAEWTVHEGDWNIQGQQSLEDQKLIQKGNIYIRGGASLLIKNSEIKIERGATPTIHVYFFVDPGGKLIIDNSLIYPGQDGGLVCVMNRGKTTITNSPTEIHYFDMSRGASLSMDNSSMIYEIGGLLQVTGGKTNLKDSTIAALGLNVPAGAHLDQVGLKPGVVFEEWKVQDLIPEADYELTFENVKLMDDDFTGEYEHGPFERGWIFFLDAASHVRLADSELRKIFLDIRNDTAEFSNLNIGKPSSLAYRDILLEDVVVQGEWPFTITNANLTLNNSDYLFLQPSGATTLKLVNSHMVEFIPRQFTGTISFENGRWTNAGEILGNVGYHSASNNFRMTGSVKMGRELRENLQWKDARVTREFDLILTDASDAPVNGASIKINGAEYLTDAAGAARFTIVFDETNYNQPASLQVWLNDQLIAQSQVDFFTETPIRLKQ